MNKLELLRSGVDLMAEFCAENKLRVPKGKVLSKAEWRFPSTCAYYRSSVITICPDACASIGTSGRAWSYPGYVIDRTPYGVMQHELGHHADHTLSYEKGAYGGDFSTKMRIAATEPKLTGYCPNDWEWFAEMFRLFVTNSDLLKAVRPRTYELIKEHFKPVIDKPWRKVLKDAPPRTIEMAARKVA
jgi:hypothetical protein